MTSENNPPRRRNNDGLQRQLELLTEKIESMTAELAVLGEKSSQAEIRDRELRDEIIGLKHELVNIHMLANRWKGGFIMIAALGAVTGWVLSSWENILVIVRGGTH